jgi:hypothetical protein
VGVGPLSYGLTTNKVSVTVSAEHIKTFYGAKIMPKKRRLSDFFPNLNHFEDLVTNTKKNIWKFKQSPIGTIKEEEKNKQIEQVYKSNEFLFLLKFPKMF